MHWNGPSAPSIVLLVELSLSYISSSQGIGEFKSSVFVSGSLASFLINLLVLFLEPLSGNRWYSLRSMVIISIGLSENSRTVAIGF